MKISNLSLTFMLTATMLGTTIVEASVHSRTTEKVITRSKKDAKDPKFKLKLSSIRELTNEEALKYELDLTNSVDKGLDNSFIINSNKIKIPGGVPGVEDGGFTGSATEVLVPNAVDKGNSGGLAVGTGAGGNSSPGFGKVTSTLDGILMIVDKLVAIGEKILPTIEKGRPVVSNKPMSAISVLPRIDAKDPVVHEMGNWSIPVTKHYRINYSNGFGSNVVSFVYSITMQYGGTYGGKGKYLAGVRMSARDIQVSWGFDLDATSELIQISNVGTQENVIAGATVEITYTVKNVMRVLSSSESFHVTGDGRIYKLD